MRPVLRLFLAILLLAVARLAAADVYQDDNLRFALPDGWVILSRNPSMLIFRSGDEKRQLTVSVLEVRRALSEKEFREFVQQRIDSEKKKLTKDDKVIEEPIEQRGPVRRAIYSVRDAGNGRLGTGVVVGSARVLALFYLESLVDDPKAHIELAGDIMTTIQVR
ncbi:MAG: hypothetical protein K0S16_731 [Moraxellaceae bacterium]|jgi:hypothetical protein|nr:hypothetical protein [Moraxellaceae bacterium]